jgi:DNA processing protein
MSLTDETKFWLALLRTPGIGCKTFLKILDYCSPPELFSQSRTSLNALGLSEPTCAAIIKPDWAAVDRDLKWLEQPANHLVSISDSAYPELLKEIPDPPPLLFIRGSIDLLVHPQIAIVGSRNPSFQGKKIAEEFAGTLSISGFTITSGLALGIDAASHIGALAAKGTTIAVAGTGLDRIYPARHKELANKIVDTGAIISEFPLGTTAKANHFPRRNRIISGLCIGLLVVEAAKQSGSLITARLALEQNREVFAIPGSIHNPLARGCNALIRDGAKLVETTQDILEEFNQYNQQPDKKNEIINQSTLDLEQQKLLNLIMYNPTSIDLLVHETGNSVEVIASMLLVLELQGYISSATGGGYVRNQQPD